MQALGVGSYKELAAYLNTAASNISNWKTKNELPTPQCIKIAERTGVSLDWLILGKGDKESGNVTQRAWALLESQRDNTPAVVFVPLYDVAVSAGNGADVYGERVIQQVPFDAAWVRSEGLHAKNLACLPIAGDSMTPGLIPGDMVLVNHATTHGDGVFVLRLGNALRIKRLQWLADGSLRISSDNPLYQPEHISPADLGEDFAIVGACHTKIGRVF